LISRRDNGKNDQFCQLFQEFAHSLPGVEGGIVRMQFEFGIADYFLRWMKVGKGCVKLELS
jgi:hypothetical protein